MSKWLPYLILAAAAAGIYLLLTKFRGKDTPEMQHADTVLVEDPAWRDSAEARAVRLKVYEDSTARVKLEKQRWRDSASVLLARNDSMHEVADKEGVTQPWMTPHDSITTLSKALDRKSAVLDDLRFEVIPAMEREALLANVVIARQDGTIADLHSEVTDYQKRLDRVTESLRKLRESTKPPLSIRLPLVGRIPVKDIAIALTSYCIGGGNPC